MPEKRRCAQLAQGRRGVTIGLGEDCRRGQRGTDVDVAVWVTDVIGLVELGRRPRC
jgi:hypothetical protein